MPPEDQKEPLRTLHTFTYLHYHRLGTFSDYHEAAFLLLLLLRVIVQVGLPQLVL